MESSPAQQLQAWSFGLSLGAVFAVSLILNAASSSARTCPDRGVEFGTIDAGLARPAVSKVSYARSSAGEPATECTTHGVGAEPGY